ncbi:MAG: transglycosylase domain-containing protein [Chloroflexota bacterium]
MARDYPAHSNGGRRDLRKSSTLTSRYLARTRSDRLARLPERRLGPSFFLLVLASFGAMLLLVALGAVYSVYAAYTTDLPPLTQLSDRLAFKTTRILDRNGNLLYEVYDREGGKRTPIHLGDVPPHLANATIATEDKDFYSNWGFDPAGIARAVLDNVSTGQIVSGASTITQQLAKNVLLDESERTDQSYGRKLREAVLAFRISQTYPKDQILEMYLNEIFYGHLSYGIEAAAQTYFGRSARDLTLAESALLAGLPQAPSQYDPFVNFDAAKDRQAHVLERMVSEGYITRAEAEQAKGEPLHLRPEQDIKILAPHFVMYVRQLLEQKYGANLVYRGGLTVTTTIDLDYNRLAENAIRDQLQYLRKQNANNAALASIDPRTGEILAMVGSKDYSDASIDGQVNVVIARRQPGSTIKPIVYVAAFSKGWAPETIVVDEPTAFPNAPGQPPYRPHNYDLKFDGAMTIRHALSNSKNIPAVKALTFVGIPDFVKIAESFGIHFDNPNLYGLSLGLGGGEARLLDMVGAYATIDNGGVLVPPVAILRIEDAEGRVVEQYTPPQGRQVVSPVHAYMITSILSDSTAREPLQGPNSPLKLTRPAAAKTGSTDDYKDSWTIGYTPNLVTGVWVGNTDSTPMKEVLGSLGAGRIWHQYMEDIHAGTPVVDFVPPPGLREYRVCKETGQLPTTDCPHVLVEVYPEGYDPVRYAVIQGLPTPVAESRGISPNATPLGQTVSESGVALQPTPTPRPGQPTPTPEMLPLEEPIAAGAASTPTPAPVPAPGPPPPGAPTGAASPNETAPPGGQAPATGQSPGAALPPTGAGP